MPAKVQTKHETYLESSSSTSTEKEDSSSSKVTFIVLPGQFCVIVIHVQSFRQQSAKQKNFISTAQRENRH